MKTKKMSQLIAWLMIMIMLFCGCQTQNEESDTESSAANSEQSESEESSENSDSEVQTAVEYDIQTIEPENISGLQQYHWVILQNGRKPVSKQEVQQINDRLQELQVENSICFHIVTMKEYVTPEILEQVNQQLGGQMDFVSLSPYLYGLSMKDWKDCFIDLTDKLTEGELKDLYSTVPSAVWEANQIADGFYSFSNTTQVRPLGYAFYQETYDSLGEENLKRLQQAKGLEDETVWKELYEMREEAVVCWTSLGWGMPAASAENPYDRCTMSKLVNGWDGLYYSYVTDDIRFNVESGAFEWLGGSETYQQLWETTKDYYQKSYIREADMVRIHNDELDDTAGHIIYGYTGEPWQQEQNDEKCCYWVPAAEKVRIESKRASEKGVGSFVYRSAQDGWESVLNVLGSDPVISGILNRFYTMTISGILQQSDMNFFLEDEDWYAIIEKSYEAADPDPLQGFIFNPVPIREQWEAYNQAAFLLGTVQMVRTEKDPQTGHLGVYEADIDSMDQFWDQYQKSMKENGIEQILSEVNRQYQEWKSMN